MSWMLFLISCLISIIILCLCIISIIFTFGVVTEIIEDYDLEDFFKKDKDKI